MSLKSMTVLLEASTCIAVSSSVTLLYINLSCNLKAVNGSHSASS